MLRVLIVEDEPYERRALSSFICHAGHEVAGEAATAREGIELANLHHPHMAFIDIRLPGGIDGLDCAKTILDQVPKTIIIILTAYAEFAYAHRALELGVYSYMLKPVSPEDIRCKIAEAEQKLNNPLTAEEKIISAPEQFHSPTSLGEKSVLAVKTYIDNHYHEPMKIRDLSAMLFLSPAYLSRLFRQHTGITIKQYLQIVRLNAAAKSLLTSNVLVREIAHAAGYEDANYFSVAFHKYFGMTPSEYKARMWKQ